MTPFELVLKDKETSRAAMVDMDAHTKLLVYDFDILRYLRRKKEDIPEKYQWPIITALTKPGTKPVSRLWLGFKRNALPLPVLRGFVREGADFVVGRTFPKSDHGWRICSILEMCARVNCVFTLDKLKEARELAEALKRAAHTESHACAAEALRMAASDDVRKAAILLCAKAVEARVALQSPNEGAVVSAMAKILSRLCEKALKQHPQGDVLRRTI